MGNKDGYKHHTRSCEGGIEAVKVLPLPLWTIMFDDVFCAEVIASMSRSNQANNKTVLLPDFRSVKAMTTLTKELKRCYRGADQINFKHQERTARQFHLQPASQGFHPPDPPLVL